MAIVNCGGSSCISPYQDRKYGKGKRVANKMANGNYRCTACLAINDEGKIDKRFVVRED